jgi:hypothetical protein
MSGLSQEFDEIFAKSKVLSIVGTPLSDLNCDFLLAWSILAEAIWDNAHSVWAGSCSTSWTPFWGTFADSDDAIGPLEPPSCREYWARNHLAIRTTIERSDNQSKNVPLCCDENLGALFDLRSVGPCDSCFDHQHNCRIRYLVPEVTYQTAQLTKNLSHAHSFLGHASILFIKSTNE